MLLCSNARATLGSPGLRSGGYSWDAALTFVGRSAIRAASQGSGVVEGVLQSMRGGYSGVSAQAPQILSQHAVTARPGSSRNLSEPDGGVGRSSSTGQMQAHPPVQLAAVARAAVQ